MFVMKDLKLDKLRSFVEVIKCGSFSSAGDKLQLTQPAVSQQIRYLEKSLGVRLIERVGKRAVPTAAGNVLLNHALKIDAAVTLALDEIATHTEGVLGNVQIGTGATACTYLLPPVLKILKRDYSALDITVKTGNTPDILKALENNTLDIGLVTLPATGRMFDITPILNDDLVAISAVDDHSELPPTITPESLADLPLVLYGSGGNTRRVIDNWFQQAGIKSNPIMELDSVEAIKQLIAAGLGYAILPVSSLHSDGITKQLRIHRLSPKIHRQLALVIRQDKPVHKGLQVTIKALQKITANIAY